MIYPDCDMKRWSHCDNSVVLANADYYYTKEQVDKKFDDFDGVTDEEVQRMINTSIRTKADKADVNALSGQVQANTDAIDNTYTKQETNAAVTAATTPINNTLTAHTADTSIHVTSAEKTYWNNKLDASAYTPTDLSNYYTKGQTDDLLDEKLDASAYTPTDLSNYYTTAQTQSYVSGFTYDKATIDQKVASGGTFDPDLYYDKTATDALLSAKADTATTYTKTEVDTALGNKADASALTAVASDVSTVSGQVATKVSTSDFNTYTAATASAIDGKADTSAVTTVNDALTAHTANTTVHVTAAEKTTWNNKSDFSGDYNDLTNKPTIPTVPTNISDFTNDAGYITNADITGKADTSAVTAVNDALTAHTANTSVHVTAAEKAEWDDKAEVIELTQAQYDALVTKDPDVLYVITDAAPAEVIISTTITSSSTNGEAASAKAVYDQMGGLKLVSLTQAQYDALSTKDASTIYFING